MTRSRWILTVVSFAAAIAATVYVVASSWPAGGARMNLPLAAHLLAASALAFEVVARAWKIQLGARALRVPVGFGAAVRTCLGGDFGAAITPARSGAEPARYLVLAEARVPPVGRLLVLFTEMFLEMVSLAAVAVGLAVVFRHHPTSALHGLVGLVGGYAAFVIGVGSAGALLARRSASGPPPRWATVLGLHAGRWRAVQRSLRQLRVSVEAVRDAHKGLLALSLVASILHVLARVAVLPALVYAGGAGLALTRATLAPLVLWPLALQYGGVVAPAPGGGGFIEAAFAATLTGAIPASIFGASLLWWRVYTFYAYVPLGALAAGRSVMRALREHGRRHTAAAGRHEAQAPDASPDAAPDASPDAAPDASPDATPDAAVDPARAAGRA